MRAVVLLVCLCVLLASGCAAPTATPQPAAPTATQVAAQPAAQATATAPAATAVPQATVAPTLAPAGAGWAADGKIGEGEYPHSATIGQMRLWWRNDGRHLYLAVEAPTKGWVAVGLDPEQRMQGANYLIGAVEQGVAKAWDAYGTAPVGASHPPDEELGGRNDILAFAGVEEGNLTRFEFQIPLDSGDKYDKPLKPGATYKVIVALGGGDGYNQPHTFRGAGEIVLDPVP
jgi:hypothetical protein